MGLSPKRDQRATGIEPAWPAWKAGTLPLSYARAGRLNLATAREAAKAFLCGSEATAERSYVAPAWLLKPSSWPLELAICRPAVLASEMKIAGFSLLFSALLLLSAQADLTIVQKVEGAGPVADMTIKIRGDKARIDASPQVTTIVDGKTGEMISLMNTQKKAVRMSAEKMKAAAEMVSEFNEKQTPAGGAQPPKLTATGKKENVNGYETEQYIYETPTFKATYWIATKYPDAANILKQLQSLNSGFLQTNTKMANYRDFPGLPLKTEVTVGNGQKITSTVTVVKQDSLSDADFSIPKDFQEITPPDISGALGGKTSKPTGEGSFKQP
jgi:hypothetical protein